MAGEPTRDTVKMPPGLEHSGPVFDRATRLARTLFGGVDAQITLKIGDGYWRSRGGDADGHGKAAGIREVMQCGEVVWVEDAQTDPRFRDELEVRERRVTFFAGAPIRLTDGSTPGALWVG